MNNGNVLVVVLAAVCGIGGGVLGARLGATQGAEVAATDASVAPESRTTPAIAALEARQSAMERGIEELRLGLADVAALQRRAVAERAEAPSVAREEPKPAAKAPGATGIAATMERLLAGDLDDDAEEAAWREIADAGKLDEMVARMEERAAARGNDPEAQTELGKAYLQKTFRAGGGPEAGLWATKADKAFDKALAADDHHWESRFQKAVSLSFWPPMLGKQTDAVRQFETLVAQQEASGSKSSGYAATYLFLGNMHFQMGAKDKAIAAWKQGAAQFPDHAELAKKLADVQ